MFRADEIWRPTALIAYLAYSLPLLGAASVLVMCLMARPIGEKVARISVGFSVLIFLVALTLFLRQTTAPAAHLASLGMGIFSIYFDSLTALMALAVSAISLLVHVYSARYMRDDPAFTRFFV
ncbi:MAG: hypothetical protein WBP72_11040, partial [Rhodocyclaceae bacterium]